MKYKDIIFEHMKKSERSASGGEEGLPDFGDFFYHFSSKAGIW
jgi:hypothetical protein